MSSSVDLPTETWIWILKFAVKPPGFQDKNIFFPPPDDFPSIEGFKNASRRLRALVAEAKRLSRNKCIYMRNAEDIADQSIPTERAVHLILRDDASRLIGGEWFQFAPRFPKLQSLSIAISDYSTLRSLEQTTLAENLFRLDLTCLSGELDSLTLDFPNLIELRISTDRPTERSSYATYLLLDDPPASGMTLNEISEDWMATLRDGLSKLQNLRLLSMHVSWASPKHLRGKHRTHAEKHLTENADFLRCKICRKGNRTSHERQRESYAGYVLAKELPSLKHIRWANAWSIEFVDEAGQKEFEVYRHDVYGLSVREGPYMPVWAIPQNQ